MILDDIELIENLKLSKATAEIVIASVSQAEVKQVQIDQARQQYELVAQRGSLLFFVIADLALIDPMYQFSLNYFQRIYGMVIEGTEKVEDIGERVSTLIKQITVTVFLNVCRGLFNSHKTLFSFLVATAIAQNAGELSKTEWNFLVRGLGLKQDKPLAQPPELKLSPKVWNILCNLKQASSAFETLPQNVLSNQAAWQPFLASVDPYLEALPKCYP